MPKMVLLTPTVVAATLAAGWQLGVHLGTVQSNYYNHGWTVASFIVVGAMAVIALGVLEPANIAVLVELKKPKSDRPLVLLTLSLVVFAVHVPMLIGFTVARYDRPAASV